MLALDGEPRRLRSSTLTGIDGAFELPVAGAAGGAVLGRERRSAVAVAGVELDRDTRREIELDAGRACRLTVSLHSDGGYPQSFNLFLDPIALDALPPGLLPWVRQLEPGVMSTHFWEHTITDRAIELRVQAGVWRLGGSFIVYERPLMIEPDFSNYVASHAIAADATRLRRAAAGGFELDLRSDQEVVLHLGELADSEL